MIAMPMNQIGKASVYGPFLTRLAALGASNDQSRATLHGGLGQASSLRSHTDLLSAHGQRVTMPMVVLGGYVASIRQLADGRRQIMRLTVPGEIFDPHGAAGMSRDTLTTLSDVLIAPFDRAKVAEDDAVAEALARDAALGQLELLNQITRLGRQSALERTGHWLLELHDRLKLAGLANQWGFELGFTQETLADILGLTSVHMNRTLQQLRREGLVDLNRHAVVLRNPGQLAQISDYSFDPYVGGEARQKSRMPRLS